MPTVLITGGNSGIGFECVKHLATLGVDIVLAGRSALRLEEAATEIRKCSKPKVTNLVMDVSSLGAVRLAAARCRKLIEMGEIDQLDAILCNAGATFRGDPSYSKDGYELTFATNYLGHFLLTQLLLDSLKDTGRVVFTASGTHDPDTADGKLIGRAVRPDALGLARTGLSDTTTLSGGQRYSTAKLCTVLHAYELDRRLKAVGAAISSVAYDPGAIAETGLLRDLPAELRALIGSPPARWLMKKVGVTTGDLVLSGHALADLAVSGPFTSGCYYQWNNGSLNQRRSAAMSYDTSLAETLWRDSENLVGLNLAERPARLT